MKRFLFLLFALATITGASAQGKDYSMLKLWLNDNSAIAVRLDGNYINRHTTSLTLDGISPGYHYLDVYSLEGTRGRRVRIYSGTIRLRAGSVHEGTIDLYHRSLGMFIRPREAKDEHDYAKSNSEDIRSDNGNQDDHSIVPQNDHNEINHADNNPRSPGNTESTNPGLPGSVMNDLHARVDSLLTDTDKEALMKKSLNDSRFTSAELRQMLYWLSFESTRLSFAQWSYRRVEDQDQYPRLEDVFEYDESRKEFKKIFSGDK